MIKLVIALGGENENFLEEVLWALEALSVSSQPQHVTERVLEALFNDCDSAELERSLRANLPQLGNVSCEPVIPEAWQENWRKHFKPLAVGSFQLVGNWEEGFADNPHTIRIYPGMAFGTGQHETTQLIIEHLESLDLKGKTVLDAGCGTGLLSIAAERLGAGDVFGFDIDPDCKENMELHLSINKTSRTRLAIGSVHDFELGSYDLILANITINILKEVWPVLKQHLAPGGLLLSSGILDEQRADAVDTLTGLGFTVGKVLHKGEWVVMEARLA